MAQPPAGSSLLFGVLTDSGQIKQRKNGSYRMVLKGVDEIVWFTDRPDRVEGTWKPQKLLRKWDSYFASSEPNGQVTFEVGDQRELFTFEMYKPKIKSGKMVFNAKPISASGADKFKGFEGESMEKVSVFIDSAAVNPGFPACYPNCYGAQLSGINLSDLPFPRNLSTDFASADLSNASLRGLGLVGADLSQAKLNNADLTGTYLDNCYLLDTVLINANMTNVSLTGADLQGANLTGATLDGVAWNNTRCPDGTMNSGFSPCTAEQLNLA